MYYSIIIPVYKPNDNLDVCLLSILGYVAHKNIEVVCVPIAAETMNLERLEGWQKRDDRVKIVVGAAPTLYDALCIGIVSAKGKYIMFMNQTDVVTSIENLLQAFTTAEQLDVQVLLTAKEQRVDISALSPSERFVPNVKLLPESLGNNVYSVVDAGINIFIMTPPVVYGNIYQQQYMAELFHSSQGFANAGALAVSQIALLYAKKISHTSIPTIRSRYESCVYPFPGLQELNLTEKSLILQITIKMAVNNAEMIVQNIMLFYLAYILSSYHPYSSFIDAAEHYKPLCKRLSNSLTNDITSHLFGCKSYISSVADSDSSSMVETYTMPARGIVFRGFSFRPAKTDR